MDGKIVLEIRDYHVNLKREIALEDGRLFLEPMGHILGKVSEIEMAKYEDKLWVSVGKADILVDEIIRGGE